MWDTLGKAFDRIEGRLKHSKGSSVTESLDKSSSLQQGPAGGEGKSLDWNDSSDSSDNEGLLMHHANASGEMSDEKMYSSHGEGSSGRKRQLMGQLRHHTAQGLRKLAESTATHLARYVFFYYYYYLYDSKQKRQ